MSTRFSLRAKLVVRTAFPATACFSFLFLTTAATLHCGEGVPTSSQPAAPLASADRAATTVSAAARPFLAATVSEVQKLAGADGAAGDDLANTLAISNDTMAIGAPGKTVNGNASQGQVYIFMASGTGWMQQAVLTAPDGAAQDAFGTAVGLSGDTLVVGAETKVVNGHREQGQAYVFARSAGRWALQDTLSRADGNREDYFGSAVAISGDTLVIGAYLKDLPGHAFEGQAYVYSRSGTHWLSQAILNPSDGYKQDAFGRSVAISNDTVVVGAYHAVLDSGQAYIYTRSGSSWSEQAILKPADAVWGDEFGSAVAIDGDTVLVGADAKQVYRSSRAGRAYVFTRAGSVWSQSAVLQPSDGADGDHFGAAVALRGGTAVVGAFNKTVSGWGEQGQAYLFATSGAGWIEQSILVASDPGTRNYFGWGVAIGNGAVAVGAPEKQVGSNALQGQAYIF